MSSDQTDGKIPPQVVDVLKSTAIGYLSVTSKKGDLYSYPVAFHYADEKVYMMTPVGSAKMKFMQENPNVSFIVENRKLALEACGAMFQGRAKVFGIAELAASILALGPKMAKFAKKYPGMFTFYARGKELPPERKLYKYRVIRIDPTKIIYWIGYKFGKYTAPRDGKGDSSKRKATNTTGSDQQRGEEGPLSLKDESEVEGVARLIVGADDEPELDPVPMDEDWLGELKAAARSGVVTEEETRVIESLRILPSDLRDRPQSGKVTDGERKLLKRWKEGRS